MSRTFSFRSVRLLAVAGGLSLSASLSWGQIPTNLPPTAGVVRIQPTPPAATPLSAMPADPVKPPDQPPTPAAAPALPPSAPNGVGCPPGNCPPGVAGQPGLTQPLDPCGPISGWGPEMPTMPVNRNTGTGPDGLGFGPCRLPRVPGAGTGVTFRQCLNNSINIARTPAIMANPNGTFTRMAFQRQKINALAEYFVIYKEEFEADGKKLTASGFRHLCGIVRRLEECRDLPIQVEIADTLEENKEIGEERKLTVVQTLMKLGLDSKLAITRVQAINYCGPRAEPLRYEMIEQVGNMASQMNNQNNGNFGGNAGNLGGGLGGGLGGFGR